MAQGIETHARNWEEDKMSLQEFGDTDFCQKRWVVLWYWAKKGNLEARHALLFLIAPPPDMLPMRMPGNSGDTITRLRDALVLSVHAVDYQDTSSAKEVYSDFAINLFKQFQLDQTLSGKKFVQCVTDKESRKCAEIAVKEKLVPTFAQYASYIDNLILSGETASCQ